MYCSKCGSKLDDGAKFCGNCGTKISNVKTSNENIINNSVDNLEGFKISSPEDSSNTASNNSNYSNNNLKNILIIFLICLVVGGLAVLGYTLLLKNKSNAEKIEYALNNILDMNGIKMDINLDLSTTYDDEVVDISFGAVSIIDTNNKLASIDINASTTGVSFNIPAYIDISNELVYFKVPTDDNWYKLGLEDYINDYSISEMSGKKLVIEDYLKNDEFIEKTDSDISGTDKYILHFTEDVLKKLSDDNNNDFDYSMLEEYGLDSFDVLLYINKKSNYLTRIVVDFSDKTFNDITFEKFVLSVDIVDTNENITIPNNVLEATPFENFDSLEEDDYVEDYKLSYNSHVINYVLPESSEASSVNSNDFKIYRKDGMRVIMSIDYDTPNSYFEYIDTEKESVLELGYTDVKLSDIRELSYDGKTFYYKELTYTTTYGTHNYEVYMCYVLDDQYIYSITFEDDDNNGSITLESMESFLNFTVEQ